MKKRKRRRRGSNRLAMMGITAVVTVLLVCLTVQSQKLVSKNAAYAQQEASLKKQIEDENDRTEEIANLEKYMQTKEYVEKIAKDKLGLAYKDEIIFKPES
ncbi:MAG: septum formation initiator family protein [Lachnospiraceae bacterium]|jgi:cell division protein DivIC|nr:septum formation initiator family protein [Lachnospiraceae bacterium]